VIVDLTETDNWPKAFEVTVGPEEVHLDTAVARLKGPVRASGQIERHAGWTEVEGVIQAQAQVDCSRCLEPIDRSLSIKFDIRFLSSEDGSERTEKEVNKSDLDSSVIDDDRIDLTEVVREQVLLDLPEQIFCKEDCKGLCPKCGSNRNLIDCSCQDEDIDPRWAALKNLK